MSSNAPFSVAIIGGGLAGLTLSIGLTHHNIPHSIYESAPAFSEIGAGIAMGPNAISALGLINPRLRVAFDKCATYNETNEWKDAFMCQRWGMDDDWEGGNGARCEICFPCYKILSRNNARIVANEERDLGT